MTKALKKVLVDRDRLMNADAAVVATDTVHIFDRIQGKPHERQLLALACAFSLLVEACNLEPFDVVTAAKNVMADRVSAAGRRPQFKAMEYHLATEVLG